MTAWRDRMNALDLDSIRLQSANGTDLTIGLADGHVWEGAQSRTPEGYTFIANIPTEEVFTAPHRLRVNGVVKGTKPYVYNGNLIEGFPSPSRTAKWWSIRPKAARRCWASCWTPMKAPPHRRGGAGSGVQPHQPAGHFVLQYAVRRERGLPHRLR